MKALIPKVLVQYLSIYLSVPIYLSIYIMKALIPKVLVRDQLAPPAITDTCISHPHLV